MFNNQKQWLESTSIDAMKEVISTHPGKISSFIDQIFEVTSAWKRDGIQSISGRKVFKDIWAVGSVGVVSHITYNSINGWGIQVEYLGPIPHEFLAEDEYYLEIPVQEFLVHTHPTEASIKPLVPRDMQKVVNDEVY